MGIRYGRDRHRITYLSVTMNRFTLAFVASMAALSTLPVLALEPWHDYFTAKAMKEKAAKKQVQALARSRQEVQSCPGHD